jgi:hypothetical protein
MLPLLVIGPTSSRRQSLTVRFRVIRSRSSRLAVGIRFVKHGTVAHSDSRLTAVDDRAVRWGRGGTRESGLAVGIVLGYLSE